MEKIKRIIQTKVVIFSLVLMLAGGNDIVNIGLHIFPKNVRPYATPCNEA